MSDTDCDFAGGVTAYGERGDDDGSSFASGFQNDAWKGGPYSAFVRSAKWPEICLWFARGCQKCLQFVLVLGLSADIFAASGAEASEPVEEQRRSGDFGL